jgi:aldose 1-epimerase
VTGYQGRANKVGGQGDVLIPFPGRVAGGAYSFNGTRYQMEKNDKEGPNAIHGFLRARVWTVTEQDADRAAFTTRFEGTQGYPFPLDVRVAYYLNADTGSLARSRFATSAPAPRPSRRAFTRTFTALSDTINADTLTVPFGSYLEFDDHLIPTGRVLPVDGTPFDFRAPRPIGDTRFNTCYADPVPDGDGQVRVRLDSAHRVVTVSFDADPFEYVVLYSGDPLPPAHARRSLAIEPMTCGSDAFNHPEWGLRILDPGQELRGAWAVTAEEKQG